MVVQHAFVEVVGDVREYSHLHRPCERVVPVTVTSRGFKQVEAVGSSIKKQSFTFGVCGRKDLDSVESPVRVLSYV